MEKDRKMMIIGLLVAAFSSPVFTGEWHTTVTRNLEGLVKSCIVVPCSFTPPKGFLHTSRLTGIWYHANHRDQYIYYEDSTEVVEAFRDRTKMLGHLSQKNCTLEIMDMKEHETGPFCFRARLAPTDTDKSTVDNLNFSDNCVTLKINHDPPKPLLSHPKTAVQGQPYSITCSVTHTCPSHKPSLTWSRGTADNEIHQEHSVGNWHVQSILTFIPDEKDDHSEVTCTAEFNGRIKSSATLTLYVKRSVNYNHIIIPIVVGLGTAVIFGVVCVVMVKKYKRRITELQNQDGSMWNRLSRLSRRNYSNDPGPHRSEQRRSIWGRFSRRPKRADLSEMPNNMYSNTSANQKVSKPRFPSPKSQPKSCNYKEDHDDGDDYMNTADLNIYGNL